MTLSDKKIKCVMYLKNKELLLVEDVKAFIKELKELYYKANVTYANWKQEVDKLAGDKLTCP